MYLSYIRYDFCQETATEMSIMFIYSEVLSSTATRASISSSFLKARFWMLNLPFIPSSAFPGPRLSTTSHPLSPKKSMDFFHWTGRDVAEIVCRRTSSVRATPSTLQTMDFRLFELVARIFRSSCSTGSRTLLWNGMWTGNITSFNIVFLEELSVDITPFSFSGSPEMLTCVSLLMQAKTSSRCVMSMTFSNAACLNTNTCISLLCGNSSIKRPLFLTSLVPSSNGTAPPSTRAEYSPKECPKRKKVRGWATKSMPCNLRKTSHKTYVAPRMAGCALAVERFHGSGRLCGTSKRALEKLDPIISSMHWSDLSNRSRCFLKWWRHPWGKIPWPGQVNAKRGIRFRIMWWYGLRRHLLHAHHRRWATECKQRSSLAVLQKIQRNSQNTAQSTSNYVVIACPSVVWILQKIDSTV